jgi:poly-beta-1,6-N-acetyl-D-glucosamine N-deacetylase
MRDFCQPLRKRFSPRTAGLLLGSLILIPFSLYWWLSQQSIPSDNATPQSIGIPSDPIRASPSHACAAVRNKSAAATFSRLPTFTAQQAQSQAIATTLIEAFGPQVAAQLSLRPFPEIAEQARQARVPVVMYHSILPQKKVQSDVTLQEFAANLQLIKDKGLTPISLELLITHLSTGIPLPSKPILLTFDDGYSGYYTAIYPLLKQYGYPATLAIDPSKMGGNNDSSGLTWAQLKEMSAHPLITIAAHNTTLPPDLWWFTDDQTRRQILNAKQSLEANLEMPIRYFIYPPDRDSLGIQRWVKSAGYYAALTTDDAERRYASQSQNLLAIARTGSSALPSIVEQAYGGPPAKWSLQSFNFATPIRLNRPIIDGLPLILISGGKPLTIHADSRYQVPEILDEHNHKKNQPQVVAAVDGGYFSLEFLDSNVMIGPVLSQASGKFVPGNASENPRLNGRPLVLINNRTVRFVPFVAERHNTLVGIQTEDPTVTDAFVAAAWLVRSNQPQPFAAFGNLYNVNAPRDRAFWGINQSGQPVIGVTKALIGAVELGEILHKAGLRDAVLLDSGASASLAYQGKSLMDFTPRPVPHVVALMPPDGTCR